MPIHPLGLGNLLNVYVCEIDSQPSCVMQIEPQPIPTLNASTPASIRFLA